GVFPDWQSGRHRPRLTRAGSSGRVSGPRSISGVTGPAQDFDSGITAMTYCVAMRLKEGLVFVSDTRTNAGVDHIATFRKMHIFERRGERSLVLLTAGNLATAQSVIGY